MSEDMLGVALRDARGPLNTLLERLSGNDGVVWLRRLNKFNRNENPFEIPQMLEVTSDGRTGEDFIRSLGKKKFNISEYAKDVMRKSAFVSTSGVTYKLVVIKGDEFDHDPTTQEIRDEATKRGYGIPAAEVAPLLREALSDDDLEKMGVWWLAVMHEPVVDSDGRPNLLNVRRRRGRWLNANWVEPGDRWGRGGGWVFLAPQSSS